MSRAIKEATWTLALPEIQKIVRDELQSSTGELRGYIEALRGELRGHIEALHSEVKGWSRR